MCRKQLLSTSSLVLLLACWSETAAFVPSASKLSATNKLNVPRGQPPLVSSARIFHPQTVQPSRLLQNPSTEYDRKSFRARFSLGKLWKSSRSKPSLSSSASVDETGKSNELDQILSRLTSAFPFFVLGSAILGLMKPSTLMWTNRGTLISWMLASVMCATGLTLEKKDFTKVLADDLAAVPAGVLCQFIIMPLSAYFVGKNLLLNSGTYGASLFLGLVLVGCSPGGTASNLVSLIARADVALSVLLTSCSTILASIATPLLVKLLVGSTIEVSGWALCEATARVVLFPVIFGMFVNAKAPNLASRVSRFTPFASVLLVSLICGGVVAQNATMFLASKALIPLLVGSVLSLHGLGFLVGYMVPRWGLRFSEITSRTISIETGMQNSALAVVLARSIGAPAVASLPGALSATAHSCLGSILAGYWHSTGIENKRDTRGGSLQVEDTAPLALQVVETEIADAPTAAVVVADEKEESVMEVVEPEEESESKPDMVQIVEVKDEPSVETVKAAMDELSGTVEELTETDKLLQKVKESGVAGVISYAAWELAFWAVSVPVCLLGYYEVAGHWPDLTNQEDLTKLGAEAFAFVNFARFAVPLRIGLALGTTPWIQDNIVDRFLKEDNTDKGEDK